MTVVVPPLREGQCCVCRKAEAGMGFKPTSRKRWKDCDHTDFSWSCRTDLEYARSLHTMPTPLIEQLERKALIAGSEKAGAFLDSIGRTDLVTLSREEYHTFFATFLDGFGESMRDQLNTLEPPF